MAFLHKLMPVKLKQSIQDKANEACEQLKSKFISQHQNIKKNTITRHKIIMVGRSNRKTYTKKKKITING